MPRLATLAHLIPLPVALLAGCAAPVGPEVTAAGEPSQPKTQILEAGAALLQKDTPANRLQVYVVAFHPLKNDPGRQMVVHHYCNQLNEDLMQCALFDANTRDAHLNGVEYIISENLFKTLPAAERGLWHPHNHEILAGHIVGPGLPDVAEKEFLEGKMNSYGKTWHTWDTGAWSAKGGTGTAKAGDALPLGRPELGWALTGDGEAAPGMVEARDRELGVDTAKKRDSRKSLAPLARPQEGE